jgi:hypothetical protein
MKTFLVICVVAAALVLEWSHRSELAVVRNELVAAREETQAVKVERVPRAELARAQAAVAATEDKLAVLERDLAGTREQLAVSQETAKEALLNLNLMRDNTPAADSLTGLVKGTSTLLDDTLVYSADAQLRLGKSVVVSSPTGLMLSDKDLATVAGDLAVETPSGTMQAAHAFIDVNNGKIEMTADSMTFSNK